MSLISRLKAVVAGDEYLDDDFDELDYASEDELNDINNFKQNPKNANALANSNPFDFMNNNRSSKVVGMPGISNCLLYTSPSPRDISGSRMPSSA